MGTAYLVTLGDHLTPFMRTPGIWALTVAALLSALSIHFVFKKRFVPAALAVGVSVLGMVFARHVLRGIVLQGHFDPATIPVVPQWGVFTLFLLFFVVALAVVAYMLRLFARSTAG